MLEGRVLIHPVVVRLAVVVHASLVHLLLRLERGHAHGEEFFLLQILISFFFTAQLIDVYFFISLLRTVQEKQIGQKRR